MNPQPPRYGATTALSANRSFACGLAKRAKDRPVAMATLSRPRRASMATSTLAARPRGEIDGQIPDPEQAVETPPRTRHQGVVQVERSPPGQAQANDIERSIAVQKPRAVAFENPRAETEVAQVLSLGGVGRRVRSRVGGCSHSETTIPKYRSPRGRQRFRGARLASLKTTN